MMKITGVLALVACAMSTNAVARAIVSIDAMQLESVPEGLSGSAQLSYSGASGNSDYSYLAASLGLQIRNNKRVNLISFSHNYGESSDVKDRDNLFLHIRHIHFYKDNRAWEAFAQNQTDVFRKLSDRYLLGLGLRFDFVHGRGFASYGLGLMGEWEELDDKTETERLLLSSYAKHRFDISDAAKITNSFYYQPDTETFDDYRLTDDFAIVSRVTDRLELNIATTYVYDSRPPVGVKKNDLVFSTGIRVSF